MAKLSSFPDPATAKDVAAQLSKGAPAFRVAPETLTQRANATAVAERTVLRIALQPHELLIARVHGVLDAVDSSREVVRLHLLNVTLPDNPTTFMRVFLNHPSPSLQAEVDDPHHVRAIAFFSCGCHGPFANFVFDVTEKLRTQKQLGTLSMQRMEVQVVVGALRGSISTVVPGLAQLAVASR